MKSLVKYFLSCSGRVLVKVLHSIWLIEWMWMNLYYSLLLVLINKHLNLNEFLKRNIKKDRKRLTFCDLWLWLCEWQLEEEEKEEEREKRLFSLKEEVKEKKIRKFQEVDVEVKWRADELRVDKHHIDIARVRLYRGADVKAPFLLYLNCHYFLWLFIFESACLSCYTNIFTFKLSHFNQKNHSEGVW